VLMYPKIKVELLKIMKTMKMSLTKILSTIIIINNNIKIINNKHLKKVSLLKYRVTTTLTWSFQIYLLKKKKKKNFFKVIFYKIWKKWVHNKKLNKKN